MDAQRLRAGRADRRVGARRSGRLVAAVAAVALLSGCGSIAGAAGPVPELVPPPGKPVGYTLSDFDISYAEDSPRTAADLSSADASAKADQLARDALSDIIDYYKSFYPDVFGHDFVPPEHYFSIGPGEGNASGCMSGPDDEAVVDNAFYCPSGDEVTYWRPLLEHYVGENEDFIVGLVFAHELGHAIQAREDMFNVRSIVAETQADCFAGTWARSVADGKDSHFKYNPADMDDTLKVWSTDLPSEVGSDPNGETQHGSAFDRVTAFQEGYEDGPTACRDNFTENRFYTASEFNEDNISADGQGNDTYENTVQSATTVYNQFFADTFGTFNASWSEPALQVGPSGDSGCQTDELVSYCAADNSVVIADEAGLRKVHSDYGDFATMTAIGLAYGTAAIAELQYSVDDPNAMKAASCLTGAVAGDLIDPNNKFQLILSPGDFDEATVMLLTAGPDNPVVDTGNVSAFDRMDAYRSGVLGGIGNCGVGG